MFVISNVRIVCQMDIRVIQMDFWVLKKFGVLLQVSQSWAHEKSGSLVESQLYERIFSI
jgi:hypothetical protein